MTHPNINQILMLLDEISKFVNFRRKAIGENIHDLLINVDNEFFNLKNSIEQLNNEKSKHLTEIEELNTSLDSQIKEVKRLKLREDKFVAFIRQIDVEMKEMKQEISEREHEIDSLNDDIQLLNEKNTEYFGIITQFQNELKNILKLETEQSSESSDINDEKNLTSQERQKLITTVRDKFQFLLATKTENEKKLSELALENQDIKTKNIEQEELLKKYKDEVEKLDDLTQDLKKALSVVELKTSELKSVNSKKEQLIKKLESEITSLQEENEEIKKVVSEQKEEIKILESETKNMTLLESKFDLISRLLSAKFIQNDTLKAFKDLLNDDFMAFANDESSLANEAEVILQLKEIEKELDIITQFPVIHKKNIISIGGAFSSGKSEFINSFLENKQYKLPVGINPVTAIPTYVVSDSQNNIKGYSNNGAAISIESEFYRKLSHDFVKSFKFNLKDIMPFITMGTPLKDLDNVCFIDTPGYNPGSTGGFTAEDKSTAEEYVAKSKVLIWMMNIEDGVLQSSDVVFLENLDLTDKKLYIVANKADRIPIDSIEDTLDEIEEILDDYEIEFEGISAYSALEKEEYHFIKKTLYDFLQEQNTEKMMDGNNIIPRVNDIMNQYDEAINEDLKEIKLLKKHMHSLELDLLQEGFEDDNAIVSNRIQEIRKVFNVKLLEGQLNTLNQLRKKFNAVLEEIFETKINPSVNTKKDDKPKQSKTNSETQEHVEQNLSPYLRKYSKPNISFS